MARSGQGLGTVIRWDDDADRGYLEVRGLPGECWVDGSVVRHSTGAQTLRAGQVVDVDWEEPDDGGLRAVRVTPREDLQATLGA
jgi:cold shock CspA family protein